MEGQHLAKALIVGYGTLCGRRMPAHSGFALYHGSVLLRTWFWAV